MESFITSWLAGSPAFFIPLALAAVGLIISERAGVQSMAAEGYMAIGAMTAAVVTLTTDHIGWAIVAGALAASALALLFAIAVVIFKCEQILAGLATLAIGLGAAGVIGRPYVHKPFTGLNELQIPGLSDLPIIGPILFQQDLLFYVAIAILLYCWYLFRYTRLGLRLSAVGEDPASADVAGVPVSRYQLLAVTAAGTLCGLGGVYLCVAGSSVWVDNMIAGRGWIALALVAFARWQPLRALGGAIFFGALEALLPRLQATGIEAPIYLMGMLPYALTILVLIVIARFGTRNAEPAALGKPYLRQDRH